MNPPMAIRMVTPLRPSGTCAKRQPWLCACQREFISFLWAQFRARFQPQRCAVSVNVAVVGATGAVGDLMRKVLVERNFPVKSIKFLASEKSAGKSVEFAGKQHTVELIRPEAFAGVQIVLSSTPGSVSKEFSPIAAKAGAIVVDN